MCRIFKLLTFITIFSLSTSLFATGISFSSGTGLDETLIQSGNIGSTSVNGLIITTDLIDDINIFNFEFDMSVELAGYKLKGSHNLLKEEMDLYYIKPKLRWQSAENYYLDIGLGVSSLSEDHWEEINLTQNILFALSLGIGISFGKQDQFYTDLVYNHFSNGYTSSPNPGLDFVTLNIGYKF